MGKSKAKKGATPVRKPAAKRPELAVRKARPVQIAAEPASKPVQAAAPQLSVVPAVPVESVAARAEALGTPPAVPAAVAESLPLTMGSMPVRTTAEPLVIHTQALNGPVNPFYGPFTGFPKNGKPVRCYLNNQETRDVNGVKLARVYANDQKTRLGWGRMVGGLVHIYADIAG